ncbi:MAG: hypothetical protein ACOC7U_06405, partial [Spirochaetota bacterium]
MGLLEKALHISEKKEGLLERAEQMHEERMGKLTEEQKTPGLLERAEKTRADSEEEKPAGGGLLEKAEVFASEQGVRSVEAHPAESAVTGGEVEPERTEEEIPREGQREAVMEKQEGPPGVETPPE